MAYSQKNQTEKYWDKGWQLVDGCTKVSEGCLNCWEETFAQRFYQKELQAGCFDFNGTIFLQHERIRLIGGKPKRICIWNDLFHKLVDIGFLTHVFDLIEEMPQHTFLIPTKRPENIKKLWTNQSGDKDRIWRYMSKGTILPNVWFGTTVENDKHYDRVKHLLKVPAAKRYLSIEPLLGEIYLPGVLLNHGFGFEYNQKPERIDWVIVGAESGANRRECKIKWVEDIVRHCEMAGIPVFVKQLHINGKLVTDINKFPKHLQIREFPK